MEVILLERIERLGQMGDVVTVKNGFARNFLLPQKKALRATASNKAAFEADRARLEADNLKRREEAEAVAAKMADVKCVMIRAAGESGQLYGSVSSRDVAEAVTEAGVSINRSQVLLNRAIKTLGLHDIAIRLHPEVAPNVVINIARSAEEAETQFETGQVVTSQLDDDDDLDVEAEEIFEEEAVEAAAAEIEEAVEELQAADVEQEAVEADAEEASDDAADAEEDDTK